jgi:mevalonate kinase
MKDKKEQFIEALIRWDRNQIDPDAFVEYLLEMVREDQELVMNIARRIYKRVDDAEEALTHARLRLSPLAEIILTMQEDLEILGDRAPHSLEEISTYSRLISRCRKLVALVKGGSSG